MSMLEPILETTRRRIDDLPDLADLRRRAREKTPARNLAGALTAGGLQVVAEIKRRSPSAGALAPGLDPVAQAVAYERGGAAAISVLTEPDHFAGSLDDLVAVRDAVAIPVLRKDFTLSPSQIWEARASGADAVLLIVAALERRQLLDFYALATELGMDSLFETHHERELDTVLEWIPTARMIGINNRDLKTFTTDLNVTFRLAKRIPSDKLIISESGIHNRDDVTRLIEAGIHAMLIGESLIRAEHTADKVRELLGLGSSSPQSG
jgi:indole-3-glycerol phosphate synthase